MRLEGALAKLRNQHKVAVLHYSPIRATVDNEPPEVIPFLGSSRQAEPIDNFGVSVVFHGHAHFGSPTGKTARGVPVYNVSLPIVRRLRPDQPYALVEFEVDPSEESSPLGQPMHVVEAQKR
jgi:Icc-related predicted phosphoesterase